MIRCRQTDVGYHVAMSGTIDELMPELTAIIMTMCKEFAEYEGLDRGEIESKLCNVMQAGMDAYYDEKSSADESDEA